MQFLSIYTYDPARKSSIPSPEEIEKMQALIGEMKAEGALLDAGGRVPTGVSLRATSNGGAISVIDGPFAESKEVVGGYVVLKVRDRAHALEIAQRFLNCAGDGTCTMYELVDMDDPPVCPA